MIKSYTDDIICLKPGVILHRIHYNSNYVKALTINIFWSYVGSYKRPLQAGSVVEHDGVFKRPWAA